MEHKFVVDFSVPTSSVEELEVLSDAIVSDRRVRTALGRALNKPFLKFTSEQLAEWAAQRITDADAARDRAEEYVQQINGQAKEILPELLEWISASAVGCKEQGLNTLYAVHQLGLTGLRMRQHVAAEEKRHEAEVEQLRQTVATHQQVAGELAARLNAADYLLDAIGIVRPEGYEGEIVQRIRIMAERGGFLPSASPKAVG